MRIEERLGIGTTIQLGTHTFRAEEIKDFAVKFDPQRFHMSEEEAKNSVFGALCASGWHTAAMWARHNALKNAELIEAARRRSASFEIGPALGLKNLKWLKPVFVGDTVAFTRTPRSQRALASRPGWHAVNSLCEAVKADGDAAMRFEVDVLIKE